MNYIVGDLHGYSVVLKALVSAIEQQDSSAVFWCVGDYCDRGPDSRGVVDFILANHGRFRCCRGNHDDCFDTIVQGTISDFSFGLMDGPVENLRWFRQFGIDETLASYGVQGVSDYVMRGRGRRDIKEISERVPPLHREFYANLPLFLVGPGFFVAHAYVPGDAAGPEVLVGLPAEMNGMMWSRYSVEQLIAEKKWDRVGYFGHTPVQQYGAGMRLPLEGEKLILLDTGIIIPDGRLTAFCHESRQIFQATVDGIVL